MHCFSDFFMGSSVLNRSLIGRSGCQYYEYCPRALYGFGCHAATQWHAKSAWMHDNAIHDLALACWSGWLSPIKRAASLSNCNSQGKAVCDWLFLNRNISRHFVLVGGKQPIDPVLSAMSSSTENQNGGVQRAGTMNVVMANNRASPASLQHMVRRRQRRNRSTTSEG